MHSNENDILFFIVVFIAIFFFLLVIMTIISFFLPDKKRSSSYISIDKKSIKAGKKRHGDNKSNQPHKSIVEGKGRESNNQPFHSDMNDDNKNGTINEKLESEKPSNNGFVHDSDENKEHGQIQQSMNDDGTVKTEIEFDSLSEDSEAIPFSQKYEYLETANNGQFRKLLSSDEKCFFKTWEENGTRKFEFHGNVDKALANINAIFDDVCDIEGKQNGSTQIINLEPGILNNQLKVEKRAKIKLI